MNEMVSVINEGKDKQKQEVGLHDNKGSVSQLSSMFQNKMFSSFKIMNNYENDYETNKQKKM